MFDSPQDAVAASYAEYDEDLPSVGDANGELCSLPPSVLEEPPADTVAVAQNDLDGRIAAAFADGAKSNDVAILIDDTEHA